MFNVGANPDIPGIRVLESRDIGFAVRYDFVIEKEKIDIAISGLLESLGTFDEFSLADHRKGDAESVTTFRLVPQGFSTMTGGHGWSSDWKLIDLTSALMELSDLVKFNHGPHWSNRGHLLKRLT